MIGKIQFYPDYGWCRMMASWEARRLRASRRAFRLGPYLFRGSVYDRLGLAQRMESWGGDELKPLTSVVIVEIDEGERGDGSKCVTFSTTEIGETRGLVIDWPEAARDPEYASEIRLHVERAYRATGYVEGDRFVTILDRLDDLIRGALDPADRSGMDD